jgi:hypothetical protein
VVAPSISDAELEAFVRDARDRHRDAEFLNIQVFDSLEAARFPSHRDGGRSKELHRIAQVRRNTGADRERIQVRGREIDP